MTDLGPVARELIEVVGGHDGPCLADKERVRQRLVASAAAAGMTGVAHALSQGAARASSAAVKRSALHFATAKWAGLFGGKMALGLAAAVGVAVGAALGVGASPFGHPHLSVRSEGGVQGTVLERAAARGVPAASPIESVPALQPIARDPVDRFDPVESAEGESAEVANVREAPAVQESSASALVTNPVIAGAKAEEGAPAADTVAQPELSLGSQTIVSALPPRYAVLAAHSPAGAAARAVPRASASRTAASRAPAAAAASHAARAARVSTETQPALSTTDDLGRELGLMNDARVALGRDRPEQALALLVRHEHEFPQGLFVEERLALRVLALCRLGEQDRAHREAEDFLRNHGASPLAARLRSSCAMAPAESAAGRDVPVKDRRDRGHEESK